MGWDQWAGDKQSFLRWDEGPFQIRSAGEPEKRAKHFAAGGGGFLGVCDGAGCEHCKAGIKIDLSYDWSVVQVPEGTAHTLTLSRRAMGDLADVRERLGSARFELSVFSCRRVGTGKKTRYHFDVVGEAAQLRAVDADPQNGMPF